jgi:hypothetical protein
MRLRIIYATILILTTVLLLSFVIVSIVLRNQSNKGPLLITITNVTSTALTMMVGISLFYSSFIVRRASKLMKTGILNVKGFLVTIGLLVPLLLV